MVASLRALVLRQRPRTLELLTRERGKLTVFGASRRFPPGAEGTFLLLAPRQVGMPWRLKGVSLNFRPPPRWSWMQDTGVVLRLLQHVLSEEQPDPLLYDRLSDWIRAPVEQRMPLGRFLIDLLELLGQPIPAPACSRCERVDGTLTLHPEGWFCVACMPPAPAFPTLSSPGLWPERVPDDQRIALVRAWLRWHLHLDPWATQSR